MPALPSEGDVARIARARHSETKALKPMAWAKAGWTKASTDVGFATWAQLATTRRGHDSLRLGPGQAGRLPALPTNCDAGTKGLNASRARKLGAWASAGSSASPLAALGLGVAVRFGLYGRANAHS